MFVASPCYAISATERIGAEPDLTIHRLRADLMEEATTDPATGKPNIFLASEKG